MNKNNSAPNPQVKKKRSLKYLFFLSCAYYTGVSFIFLLIAALSSSAIPSLRFLWMLPLSVCFALGQFVLEMRELKNGLRVVYHSLICVFSAFAFLWVPYAIGRDFIQFVYALIVFAGVYWLIAGLTLLVSARIRAAMEKD